MRGPPSEDDIMRAASLAVGLALLVGAVSTTHAGSYVGKEFPNFQATDAITGKPIALADLRGKVVLIDFWATWCGPCVRELPNIKRAFQKYHDEGLEIISISLDTDAGRFKKFVGAQGMRWHHVMDGKGWEAALARTYGIRSIPAMFVIDHKGICVSDSARGAALDREIKGAIAKMPREKESDKEGAPDRPASAGPKSAPPAAPDPAKPDPAALSALRSRLDAARKGIQAVSRSARQVRDRLAAVEVGIAALEDQMPMPRDVTAARASFERIVDDLGAIRHELFVGGFLSEKAVALPDDPFASGETDARSAVAAIRSRLEPARAAARSMTEAVLATVAPIDAMADDLEALERQLDRAPDLGAINAKCEEAEALVAAMHARLDEPWKGCLRTLDAALEAHAEADGAKAGPLDEIDATIAKCRELVIMASQDPTATAKARAQLGTICDSLRAVAEQAVRQGAMGGMPADMPENALAGADASGIQARVQAAQELERAKAVAAKLRAALDRAAQRRAEHVEQIRELQAELDAAAGEKAKERAVKERFDALCREIVESWNGAAGEG
jgi:peroxiredoxin